MTRERIVKLLTGIYNEALDDSRLKIEQELRAIEREKEELAHSNQVSQEVDLILDDIYESAFRSLRPQRKAK